MEEKKIKGFDSLTSTWLKEYEQTPERFVLVENHNKDSLFADALNPITLKATATSIHKLISNLDSDGNIAVTYVRRKYGRWFPEGPCSTKLWKKVRWGTLPSNYVDVDGVNCFPTLAAELCKLHKIECPELQKFIAGSDGEGRKKVYESLAIKQSTVQAFNKKNRDNITALELAKLIMNIKMYGGGQGAWNKLGIRDPFQKMTSTAAGKLAKEWKQLSETFCLMEDYAELIKWSRENHENRDFYYDDDRAKKSVWHAGCGYSLILQSLEALLVHNFKQDLEMMAEGSVKIYEYDGVIYDEKILTINDYIKVQNAHKVLRFKLKSRGTPLASATFSDVEETDQDSEEINEKNPLVGLIRDACAEKIGNITSSPVALIMKHLIDNTYVCTDTNKGIWYHFSDHRWQKAPAPIDYVNTVLVPKIQKLENVSEYTNVLLLKLSDITFKKKVVEDLSHRLLNTEFLLNLDTNPNLLGFNNGIYDLKENVFRDGKPTDMVSMTVGYDYSAPPDTEGTSPDMDSTKSFLSQVFPNPKCYEYWIELGATFLEGVNRAEELYILTGAGGNGKSKLMELMKMILGDYYADLPTEVLTGKNIGNGQGASPFIVGLKNKRLVIASEDNKGSKFNEGLAKRITGNDYLSVRANYGDPVQFKCQFKLGIVDNSGDKEVKFDTSDPAWIRRIKYINFPSQFVDNPVGPLQFKRDRSLNLESFRLPLLHLLLNQYANWRSNGYLPLVPPKELVDYTNSIFLAHDPVRGFFNAHMEPTPSVQNRLFLKDAWQAYCIYEINHGFEGRTKKNEFKSKLTTLTNSKTVDYRHLPCWDNWQLVNLPVPETNDELKSCQLPPS